MPKKKRSIKKSSLSKTKNLDTGEISNFFLRKALIILTAFTTGASVMIIELAANRVLAPWFGNSLYTWTGLIGVILLSLSIGYYLGGWLADKNPNFRTFFHIISASSILIFIIPFINGILYKNFPYRNIVIGPLFASLLLFSLPGILLGSVSPYAIRLVSLLSSDKKIGVSAGSIAMFSTLGSVLGTFTAGFFLIPTFKLSMIFFVTSFLLLFLSLFGYFLFEKKTISKYSILNMVLLVLLVLGAGLYQYIDLHKEKNILFDKTTFYHRIRVVQTEEAKGQFLRSLFLDTTSEGGQYVNSSEIPIEYQKYWELSKIFCNELKRAAFLGAGSFTMPEAISQHYKAADIDVIEIDPEVIQVGRKFFKLGDFNKIGAISDDARRFLQLTTKRYDLIFGDAFNGIRYVPAHLLTQEFFELVNSKLNTGGAFMINIISSLKGAKATLFKCVMRTLEQAFTNSYVFPMIPFNLHSMQNIIIVSSDLNFDVIGIKEKTLDYSLRSLLKNYVPPDQYEFKGGTILTDNYNPIDYIVAKGLL